jgi:magnesium-transporting ATPase (P-type)
MTAQALVDLIKSRNTDEGRVLLEQQGGINGLLAYLDSHPHQGIQSVSTFERRERYGVNTVATLEGPSYLRLLMDACSDITIMILAGAAVVSLVIALAYERTLTSYAEAIAILVSITVVTNVAAINDWNKQRHFAKLSAEASKVMVRALRDGAKCEIDSKEVVVGDTVLLNVGEIVCADGLLLRGDHVSMDESALTGEAMLVRKDVVEDLFVLSGTKVMEGEGSFLVLAVGEHSEAGEIQKLVQQEVGGKSVLTAKLDRVVILIGKLGLLVSIGCFVIMLVRFVLFRFIVQSTRGTCARINNISSCMESPFPACTGSKLTPCCVQTEHGFMIEGTPCGWQNSHLSEILNFFITAVTILVVAVPEGLPLAVTLALAFAGRRMQKEQNLVKHLDACETMGSATTICSDKVCQGRK